MRAGFGKFVLGLALLLTLSACGNRPAQLLNLSAGSDSPDEFAILPGKPLQQPESYSALPAPTPGGSNLTDPRPNADAIVALGGNPSNLTRTDIPNSDSGLVNYARRAGVQNDIRARLAAADEDFRSRNKGRILPRLFRQTQYFDVYSDQELNQHAELARLRAAGVKTPSVPPEVVE